MLDPRLVPKDAPRAAKEEYLSRLLAAMDTGTEAMQRLARGDVPDLEGLDEYARVVEALHIGAETGTLSSNLGPPSAEDVTLAARPAELVRRGAPVEEMASAAKQALRILATRNEDA